MEWFSGNIADAVRISKERHVIFIVFIDGKTDDSATLGALLDDVTICSKLSDPARYLAVRIESDTDTYKQFAQIYRLVPVPSLFFIGEFGQPIEIVAGNMESVDALNERIAVAEGIFYKTTPATPSDGSAAASSSNPATTPIPPPVVQSVSKPVAKKQPAKVVSAEDKMTKEDLEMQKLKEERKREKAQDEEARRRVLEQIKLDRLRRQNVEPIVNQSKPATQATPPPPIRHLPDTTRIQFRKPSGESIVDTFKSAGPFGDVWKYAKASVDIKDFVLAIAMPPRKEFSAEHSEQTLIELNLAPSAVLLVIPLAKPSLIGGAVNNNGGVVATITNFIFTIFWTLMTPLMALWDRIRGVQPRGRPEPATAPGPVQGGQDEVPGPNIGSEILQKRNLSRYNLGPNAGASGSNQSNPPAPKATEKKSTSNIHRLKDYDSDDNESNTYNGNSTQQM